MQLEVEQNGEKTVYVFSDITINDWYVPAVNYVVTNGLMSGTDVGGGLSLFRPNYGMTRAQLAAILYRFAGGRRSLRRAIPTAMCQAASGIMTA